MRMANPFCPEREYKRAASTRFGSICVNNKERREDVLHLHGFVLLDFCIHSEWVRDDIIITRPSFCHQSVRQQTNRGGCERIIMAIRSASVWVIFRKIIRINDHLRSKQRGEHPERLENPAHVNLREWPPGLSLAGKEGKVRQTRLKFDNFPSIIE